MSDVLEKYELSFKKVQAQRYPDLIGVEAEVIKKEDGNITMTSKYYSYDMTRGSPVDKRAWIYKEIKESINEFELKNYIENGTLTFKSSETMHRDRFDRIEG